MFIWIIYNKSIETKKDQNSSTIIYNNMKWGRTLWNSKKQQQEQQKKKLNI